MFLGVLVLLIGMGLLVFGLYKKEDNFVHASIPVATSSFLFFVLAIIMSLKV